MAARRIAQKNDQKSSGPTLLGRYPAAFFQELAQDILGWYAENERDLPWRKTRDPYAILVSELMLQQTQAPRVVPKFTAFMKQFPTVESLANAPLGEVLRSWSGLGYNRRAKYLQLAAGSVMAGFDGKFPRSPAELAKLPGVGPYTAGALSAFAFNDDVVILETNIKRIYQLIFSGDDQSEATMKSIGERLLPGGRARDWYHALMDLGSYVRTFSGASAQQLELQRIFPILEEVELPKFSNNLLVRPRQSSFVNSNRYYRGQILKILGEGDRTLNQLKHQLNHDALPQILSDLVAEGLVVVEADSFRYSLP